MKGQYVKDIRAGQKVSGYFAVSDKSPLRPYNSKPGSWFGFRASDKTGGIDVKFWGGPDGESEKVHASIAAGGVVNIRGGDASTYREQLQIGLNAPDQIGAAAEFDPDELVASADGIDGMVAQLRSEIKAVADPDIRRLLESIFDDDFVGLYSKTPASRSHHHGYVGGLLEHSLSMVSVARAAARQHGQELDEDLLVAGCILHDIGKVGSYKTGAVIESTAEGSLLGHIPVGAMLVSSKIDALGGFPPKLKNKILHLVLSHHGSLEAGSPVRPQFPEALALHKIDDLDAQTKYAVQVRKEHGRSGSVRDRMFGHMYLE